MAKNTTIHRILAFLKHRLTAWNTTGEGIHSPYLFELVRFVLRDENAFYCFSEIEGRRALLLDCADTIDVVDYGSAGSPEGTLITRRVCDIARTHLESPRMAQILFRLANFLTQKAHRPLQILELGTSFGITTAYLASVDTRNSVITYEGSNAVLRIAQGVWRALRLENIEWVEGNIDETLFATSPSPAPRFDLAYVDANHTYEATMRYVDYLLSRMDEKGIIVIDDIHYSEAMELAWNALKADPRVTTSMDLYALGMLFVDPHYLKRHYIIRI
jgi:predicted O-methyltransferase YrrM